MANAALASTPFHRSSTLIALHTANAALSSTPFHRSSTLIALHTANSVGIGFAIEYFVVVAVDTAASVANTYRI